MIFKFAGDVVQGGWNAIDNIVSGIGKGASTLVSGFFPTPQREKVGHLDIAPAGAEGLSFRPTTPEMQSLLELARPADVMAFPSVETKKTEGLLADIWGGLRGAATASQEIKTVVSEIMGPWLPRETVYEKPRAGYPAGVNQQHLTDLKSMAAAAVTATKTAASQMLNQVKGLFGLGYGSPAGPQPVFTIAHELDPKTKMTAVGLAVAVIVVLLLLKGRK